MMTTCSGGATMEPPFFLGRPRQSQSPHLNQSSVDQQRQRQQMDRASSAGARLADTTSTSLPRKLETPSLALPGHKRCCLVRGT